MCSQDWFPLGLTGLISLLYKGLSKVFFSTAFQKHQLVGAQSSLCSNSTSSHDYWKNNSFDCMDLCWQVMSLLFNTLSRFVIAFLPISWWQSPSTVILESKKRKSATVSIFPIYLPWSDGTRCHDLSFFFLMWLFCNSGVYRRFTFCREGLEGNLRLISVNFSF